MRSRHARLHLATGLVVAVWVPAARGASPTIDGILSAGEYPNALVVQTLQTQFGDSNLGQADFANGSELDAGYGKVEAGVLYLLLTGNVESNFNKLELFFDSTAGGQNTLRSDNVDIDFNGLNRMGLNPEDPGQKGLTFDAGPGGAFEADFWITVTGGDDGAGQYQMFVNYATLPTEGGGVGKFSGGVGRTTSLDWFSATSPADGTGEPPFGAPPIDVAIDNSNTAGVEGGTGPSGNALTATTGVELAIPLAAIGNPTGAIRVVAMINGTGHDFLSNQVLGALPDGTSNLGEPRLVDFSTIAGEQFFVIPSAALVIGDADGDGDVDGNDIAIWAQNFTGSGATGGTRSLGDFDGDGDIDGDDAAAWAQRFTGSLSGGGGAGAGGSLSAVPEPVGLSMGVSGAAVLLRRRRRGG